jgi:hypothetical protein
MAMPVAEEKLQQPKLIRRGVGRRAVHRSVHRPSRAMPPARPSPFDEAAILTSTVLGVEHDRSGVGRGSKITLTRSCGFPLLGLLYSAFTTTAGSR